MPNLPEEEDIVRLWQGPDRKKIKPVGRGGGQEGRGGDVEDNITDGPLITAGSQLGLCVCVWVGFKGIIDLSQAMMCVTSDLEEGHRGPSVHGAVLYRCLICQVVNRLYRHLHPLDR